MRLLKETLEKRLISMRVPRQDPETEQGQAVLVKF